MLSEKDVTDVKDFCAKNKMDYIAVSFVQTGDDIKLVRKTLDAPRLRWCSPAPSSLSSLQSCSGLCAVA